VLAVHYLVLTGCVTVTHYDWLRRSSEASNPFDQLGELLVGILFGLL
jgi:hypothetical protein